MERGGGFGQLTVGCVQSGNDLAGGSMGTERLLDLASYLKPDEARAHRGARGNHGLSTALQDHASRSLCPHAASPPFSRSSAAVPDRLWPAFLGDRSGTPAADAAGAPPPNRSDRLREWPARPWPPPATGAVSGGSARCLSTCRRTDATHVCIWRATVCCWPQG